MPGSEHGPSIKNPKVYEALRRKGYSKSKAAAISNAMDEMVDDAQRIFASALARALKAGKSEDQARRHASAAVRSKYGDGLMTIDEIMPVLVKTMPAAARSIFRAAYNKARKEDHSDLAAILALNAVRKKWQMVGEEWVEREPEDPEDDEDLEAAGGNGEDDDDNDDDEDEHGVPKRREEPDGDDDDDDDDGDGDNERSQPEYTKTTKTTTETSETRKGEIGETGDSAIELEELLTLDAKGFNLTSDGYLTAEPRIARIGIQIYKGYEVGRPDMDEVRVYRPPEEVFNKPAMKSMAHRPITLNHPFTKVDASNWKELSVGHSGGDVARDGEFVRVPLVLMDAHAIAEAQTGKSQLSVGYGADLKWAPGQTPDGQLYDAMQQNIRANHIALVSVARGGDKLKIGDEEADELCEDGGYFDREFSQKERKKLAKTGAAMPHGGFPIKSGQDLRNAVRAIGRAKNPGAAKAHIKKRARALGLTKLLPASWDSEGGHRDSHERRNPMTERLVNLDGVTIELDDKDGQILERHLKALNDSVADMRKQVSDAQAQVGTLTAQVAELNKATGIKDGEIAVLNKKIEDGKVTPVMLDDFCRRRLDVVGRAVRVLGDNYAFDNKTDAQIRRDVVIADMGEAMAKDMTDENILGAFNHITKSVTPMDGNSRLAASFSGRPVNSSINDAAAQAYDKRNESLNKAYLKNRRPFAGTPA